MEKTAMAFLVDYRSGAIGRISLETPQSRSEMIATSPTNTEQEASTIKPEEDNQDGDNLS